MLDWLRRLAGATRKETPQELLGLASSAIKNESGGYGYRSDLYYLLEEEKVPRELWPWILAYVTRTAKLTYLDEKEIRFLRWKIIAHEARIMMAIDNQLPPPEYFPSLDDYRRYVDSMRMLPGQLMQYMLFTMKRSYLGFERRLQASRTLYVGYARG